jgi:hypothetical protein
MKRLALLLGAAIAALAFAMPALADDPSTTAPVGTYTTKKVDVMLYVDTISSTRGDVVQKRGCAMTSQFTRGNRVVWRMWAVDTATGKPLTDVDLKYAYVKLPGSPNLPFTYGKHGKLDISPWFFTAVFPVPTTYALGTVPFTVVVKTKDNKFGTFTQPVDAASQLTIIP